MPDKINLTRISLLLWLLLATTMVIHGAQAGLSLSTDDAMRLAETRDLLHGQSWFDIAQWRMNVPYGLPMHWSRLVDAGLAGPMLFFRLFMRASAAETCALYAWPVLMLLPCVIAIGRIGARLGSRMGGLCALFLFATCVAAMEPFRPGSVDHDNVQIALTLWMLASILDFEETSWAPIAAAVLACLSLAVGMQTLPYIAVGLLAVAIRWIQDGAALAPRVRIFGIAFALCSVLLLGGATASVFRFSAACDTFSGLYAALGVAGGLGLAVAASLPTRSWAGRCIAVVALGAMLIALVAICGPACLKGPYAAVDARLGAIWLARVNEVQSPYYFFRTDLAFFIAGYCYAVLAAVAAVAVIFFPGKRNPAAIVAAFAVTGVAVSSIEMRGLVFALVYGLPGLAALIVAIFSRIRFSRAIASVSLAVALALSSDTAFALAATTLAHSAKSAKATAADGCSTPGAFAQLASLPRGRVLGFVDLGSYVLAYTQDGVVGGPYHRNATGILDSYAALMDSPERSAQIVKRRGIDYLAICKASPDYSFILEKGGRNSVLADLASHRQIAWISPVAPGADHSILLYKIVKARLP